MSEDAGKVIGSEEVIEEKRALEKDNGVESHSSRRGTKTCNPMTFRV